jgi:hypothetical protein
MIEVHYCEGGMPVSDFDIYDYVNSLGMDCVVFVSTADVIHELRARIAEDKLKVEDVEVYIGKGKEHPFIINQYGAVPNWHGVLTNSVDISVRILKGGCLKRKAILAKKGIKE